MDIDYALLWNFLDVDGRLRQLRFRRESGPQNSPDVLCGTGQLIAVIAEPGRTDRGDTIAISRPAVVYTEVEQALDGWQNWAMIAEDTVNLAEIRRRIHTAGLD